MTATVWIKPYESRRAFIGGSDARIIMGTGGGAGGPLARKTR
jgi:hypothetical protein